MNRSACCHALLAFLFQANFAIAQAQLKPSPWFDERILTEASAPDVRIHANAPADGAATTQPTRVMVYALPNGNTLEQTLGCKMTKGLDWHYDIQHVAAQVRLLREIKPDERLVLVCAEAAKLSWPSWRSSHKNANELTGKLLDEWRNKFGGADA
jgi:hypothetical protein